MQVLVLTVCVIIGFGSVCFLLGRAIQYLHHILAVITEVAMADDDYNENEIDS